MNKRQVRVLRPGADQTELVRALRLIGRLDLKRAHDLAVHLEQHADTVVIAGVDAKVADYVAELLLATGAEVRVQASSVDSPMICMPEANVIYEWGAMRTIRARKAG